MIGNPKTSAEWSRALRADVGDEVLRILMPFHERPIAPRQCRDTAALAAAARTALEGLGVADGDVKIVSLAPFHDLCGGVSRLSECVDLGLFFGLRNEVKSFLNDAFRPAFGAEFRHNDGLSLLQTIVYEQQYTALRITLSGLADTVSHNFFSCIYNQIGFLAMGRKDVVAKIAPFTSMLADGHLPLGLTEDKTLLVLTD